MATRERRLEYIRAHAPVILAGMCARPTSSSSLFGQLGLEQQMGNGYIAAAIKAAGDIFDQTEPED